MWEIALPTPLRIDAPARYIPWMELMMHDDDDDDDYILSVAATSAATWARCMTNHRQTSLIFRTYTPKRF